MSERDQIYLGQGNGDHWEPEDFVFDERVVKVFPDMIRRSIPGYNLVVPNTALLARRYAQDESVIYDLGCSLGAVTVAMQQAVTARNVRIVAVDSSADMLEKMRSRMADGDVPIPVELVLGDICDLEIHNASVVILNFTLQFVAPDCRAALLHNIVAGLRPGGVLVLSEKLAFSSSREDSLQSQWHHDFKRAQGYSNLEIAAKRDALEKVMQPDTAPHHLSRLEQAGFGECYCWMQCFNFASFVAIK